MSLKSELEKIVEERKYLTYGEFVSTVVELGYKVSNAERRMRESQKVKPVFAISKRGTSYISAYEYQWPPSKKPPLGQNAVNTSERNTAQSATPATESPNQDTFKPDTLFKDSDTKQHFLTNGISDRSAIVVISTSLGTGQNLQGDLWKNTETESSKNSPI